MIGQILYTKQHLHIAVLCVAGFNESSLGRMKVCSDFFLFFVFSHVSCKHVFSQNLFLLHSQLVRRCGVQFSQVCGPRSIKTYIEPRAQAVRTQKVAPTRESLLATLAFKSWTSRSPSPSSSQTACTKTFSERSRIVGVRSCRVPQSVS